VHKAGLVVFAFGCPSTIRSNVMLMDGAIAWHAQYGGPIYTQEDIDLPNIGQFDVKYIGQLPDQPPSTLRIAREAIVWARNCCLEELHIRAAAPHMSRCLRDLAIAKHEQRSLVSLVESSYPDRIPFDDWFCPDSTQPRVRTFHDWEGREKILRVMPVWLYKLIAS